MLAMTYVLFDPDLGTPVPLFQEFTCRGRLDVTASDPQGAPSLRAPEMALKMSARADDGLRPAYFIAMKREAGSEWEEYYAVEIPAGDHLMHVSPVTEKTEMYVIAKDLEGRYCSGRSSVLATGAPAAGSR
jgi:hypothetical protein